MSIESIQKQTDKDYGIDVMVDAYRLLEEEKEVISVSPMIDMALGGGIPEGSWVIISGPEKLGKSATALQICANAQSQDREIYFYTPEGRIKERDINSVHNLDPNKNFKIIGSTQNKILVAEDYINHAISVLKSCPRCVVVLDSGSALCARQEFDGDITGVGRAIGPRILASFCRQMGAVVSVQNSILIITQHLIANTSGYGSPFYEDGGRKVQYQVDVKLRGKSVQPWKKNPEDKSIGQIITWEVKSSALSGVPGTKVQSYLRYGYGLDAEMEYFQLGIDLGLIGKAASWYTLDFVGEDPPKVQGEIKALEWLREHPESIPKLKERVKGML